MRLTQIPKRAEFVEGAHGRILEGQGWVYAGDALTVELWRVPKGYADAGTLFVWFRRTGAHPATISHQYSGREAGHARGQLDDARESLADLVTVRVPDAPRLGERRQWTFA